MGALSGWLVRTLVVLTRCEIDMEMHGRGMDVDIDMERSHRIVAEHRISMSKKIDRKIYP